MSIIQKKQAVLTNNCLILPAFSFMIAMHSALHNTVKRMLLAHFYPEPQKKTSTRVRCNSNSATYPCFFTMTKPPISISAFQSVVLFCRSGNVLKAQFLEIPKLTFLWSVSFSKTVSLTARWKKCTPPARCRPYGGSAWPCCRCRRPGSSFPFRSGS